MDRCAAAYAYHKQGYNCAQSVAGAFADLTGTAPEQLMAAMRGFGGGVGGSHEAVSYTHLEDLGAGHPLQSGGAEQGQRL